MVWFSQINFGIHHFPHKATESRLDITATLGYTNYMENMLYILYSIA